MADKKRMADGRPEPSLGMEPRADSEPEQETTEVGDDDELWDAATSAHLDAIKSGDTKALKDSVLAMHKLAADGNSGGPKADDEDGETEDD